MKVRGISLRRSCALLSLSHSSLRYRPRLARRERNHLLAARLRGIAKRHPRYGYRRAHALLENDVGVVNVKRVHRLWREEHLCVPARRTRRRRSDRKEVRPVEGTRPNHVWTYDFLYDTCANGQRLKLLTVTDEFTRERLAIEVGTRLKDRLSRIPDDRSCTLNWSFVRITELGMGLLRTSELLSESGLVLDHVMVADDEVVMVVTATHVAVACPGWAPRIPHP